VVTCLVAKVSRATVCSGAPATHGPSQFASGRSARKSITARVGVCFFFANAVCKFFAARNRPERGKC